MIKTKACNKVTDIKLVKEINRLINICFDVIRLFWLKKIPQA